MHIGHNVNTSYEIIDGGKSTILEVSKEEKDLGMFITNDLKPSVHCLKSAKKAQSVLGMIRRCFNNLDKEDFLLLYKTYIRPHLEYCVQAWSPHLRKDIDCLERVQRRATKLVKSLRKLPYIERLQKLGLTSLEQRRLRGDLIETYKILTEKENLQKEQFFKKNVSGYSTRGHSLKLYVPRSLTTTRQHFFSVRVVVDWNDLPQHVVDASTVNSFKNRLDKHWKKDMKMKS